MEALHLDTHVLLWLWQGEESRLRPIKFRLEGKSLCVAPIALLEAQLLYEIGRITDPAERIFADLAVQSGVQLAKADPSEVIKQSLPLNWTRDPFDRLIVAQAMVEDATLLTKDRLIRQRYKKAFWDK